jgi:hypothetical protein
MTLEMQRVAVPDLRGHFTHTVTFSEFEVRIDPSEKSII